MNKLTFKQQLLLTVMANPEFVRLARDGQSRYTMESTFAKSVHEIVNGLSEERDKA